MTFLWSCDHCQTSGLVEAVGTSDAIDRAREAHAAAVPACPWSSLGGRPADPGPEDDPVSAPRHYRSHPSGIEPIAICEHEDFLIGNVLKYVMRHKYKGAPLEDLSKARFYLDRAIERLEKEAGDHA